MGSIPTRPTYPQFHSPTLLDPRQFEMRGPPAAGRDIDVWVTDEVLQFFDGDHLVRTEKRVNSGPVRKKRTSVPARPAAES